MQMSNHKGSYLAFNTARLTQSFNGHVISFPNSCHGLCVVAMLLMVSYVAMRHHILNLLHSEY